MEVIVLDGYFGVIQLLVVVDFSGMVFGICVIEYYEMLGLGDKIEFCLLDWIIYFVGKVIYGQGDSYWVVKKDGGDFDQFIGVIIIFWVVVNVVKCVGLYV